jgi:HEPN domain-containing protein
MSEADRPSETLALRWFNKAENDLLNVHSNLRAERYATDTVCFHCQQAAEKYLKGLLAWHHVPFAKTHDLAALLQQLKDCVGEEADQLLSSILLLDDYSVGMRYPQEY